MHWNVYFEIKCKESDLENIRHQLYSHHCTLSAEPQIGGDDEIIEGDFNKKLSSSMLRRIICYARMFHKDDEEYFNLFVNKLIGEKIPFIHIDSRIEKIKKIIHSPKYSAIIVFVVIFSHELIIIFIGEHQEKFWSELWTIFWVSMIGGISALVLDSIMIWRERNI